MAIDRVNNGGPARPGNGNKTTGGVDFHSKRIQAGLSTQIVLSVEENNQTYVIGAVQSLQYKQTRNLERIKEIGTDATIGIVPTAPTQYDITIQRLVFDFQRLPQALQREYRHIHAQRRPFNIVITDYNSYLANQDGPNGDNASFNAGVPAGSTVSAPGNDEISAPGTSQVKTTFQNCWFTSMDFTYSATDYQITENATLYCETVFDSVAPATLVGERDALERASGTSAKASVLSAFDADA